MYKFFIVLKFNLILRKTFFWKVGPNQALKNICDSNSVITNDRGLIISPQYPSPITPYFCSTKIAVPSGKSINVWLVDLLISARDSSGKYQY